VTAAFDSSSSKTNYYLFIQPKPYFSRTNSNYINVLGEENAPSLRSLTDYELRMGEEAGYSYVDRLTQLEEDLIARGMFIPEGSQLSRMAKFK